MSIILLFSMELDRCYCGKPLREDHRLYDAAPEEQHLTETEAYQDARAYFTERLRDREFVLLSSGDGSKTGRQLRSAARIPVEDCDRWCDENGFTPEVLFQSAFAYAMSMLCRQRQVAYGFSFHGRNSLSKPAPPACLSTRCPS